MLTLQDYNSMNTAALVDLLAQETQKITQLMSDREFTAEYEQSKNIVKVILAIIESRKDTSISEPPFLVNTHDNTSISDPNIMLPE